MSRRSAFALATDLARLGRRAETEPILREVFVVQRRVRAAQHAETTLGASSLAGGPRVLESLVTDGRIGACLIREILELSWLPILRAPGGCH
jgi:hypothetical protein